jgi:FkbM family methyltransferase
MISYCRNFEDVMLQRVFADVSQGCFIDVGASMPIADSNTYALYQKGWRGVAVEPLPYGQFWDQARPQDVFLNAAVGERPGVLTLQVFENTTQISTGDLATLENWKLGGVLPSHSIQVPTLTLDQIVAEHLPGRPLHLLSIDVEGMEHAVLQGLNLGAHRPWVVVLEATVPGCALPAHEIWEPLLSGAEYRMAYFDGVNRFYVAREKSDLLQFFALPPNVWDNFVTAEQLELRAEVGRLRAEIARLQGK